MHIEGRIDSPHFWRRLFCALVIWTNVVLDIIDIGNMWKFVSYLTIWGIVVNGIFFTMLVIRPGVLLSGKTHLMGELCMVMETMITTLYWGFGTQAFISLPNALEKVIGVTNHLIVFIFIAMETFVVPGTAKLYTFHNKDVTFFLPLIVGYIFTHIIYLNHHDDVLYPQINKSLTTSQFITTFAMLAVYFVVCFEVINFLHHSMFPLIIKHVLQ